MTEAIHIVTQGLGTSAIARTDMDPCLAITFIAFIIIVGGVWAALAAKKRREAVARVAEELALRFEPERDTSRVRGQFDHIDLLRQGHTRYSENHLIGSVDNCPIVACDYHYTTGSGKHSQHHSHGIVFVQVPLWMPEVRIRQEHFFDKLVAAVGFEDIDFESADFSGRYHVSAADRKFAYDLIHARAIEHLLKYRDYCWECDRDTIAVYQARCFKPEEIERAIRAALRFVDLIPQFVREDWNRLKGNADAS